MSFVHQVPDLPGVAQVDLVGPNGLLESRVYSTNAPTVALTVPDREGGEVPSVNGFATVEWSGEDLDGDQLFYSVLYSPDGGQNWNGVPDAQLGTSLVVPIDPGGTNHRIRVLVSDGTQSA